MRSITLVGGGIASLLLGVELLRHRFQVELITADSPERAGGHLASWEEQGYPVEHGFHALFDFYVTARSLLEQHQLLDGFIEGPERFFVYRSGELAPMHHGAGSLWPPLTRQARIAGLPGMLPGLQMMERVHRGDEALLAALDAEDFRATLRRLGAGPEFVGSPLVQMFYDFGFNGERRLSSAVAFSVLSRLLRGGRMLHFPGPSRQTLIDPLRRRFLALGGRLRERTRLERVLLDAAGQRVQSILTMTPEGSREETVEELVLGLDLESLRALRWSGERPRFLRGVQRLQSAVSLSLQVWFERDPAPPWLDSVMGGLPEPWSTVCPVSRVRKQNPGPHGFEFIACGPETGFEGADEEDLLERFCRTMRRVGLVIPENRAGMHAVLRRNSAPQERYLLTRPGELWLRPSHDPGVEGLHLVGAWLRTAFPMPSVEAAAQTVVAVRDTLLRRYDPSNIRSGPWTSPHELCPAPPYRHEGTTRLFFAEVDPGELAARCPPGLLLAPGFSSKIALFFTEYDGAYALQDPTGVRHQAREIMLAAVVLEPGATRPPGLFPFVLYIDSDVALAVGREVYGFQKRLGTMDFQQDRASLSRKALREGERGVATPQRLLHARWRRGEAVSGSMAALAALGGEATAMLVDSLGGVALYNQATPKPVPGLTSPLLRSALLRVPAFDIHLGPMTRLHDARIELTVSPTDPLAALLPRGQDALTSGTGFEFRLGFTIDQATELPAS